MKTKHSHAVVCLVCVLLFSGNKVHTVTPRTLYQIPADKEWRRLCEHYSSAGLMLKLIDIRVSWSVVHAWVYTPPHPGRCQEQCGAVLSGGPDGVAKVNTVTSLQPQAAHTYTNRTKVNTTQCNTWFHSYDSDAHILSLVLNLLNICFINIGCLVFKTLAVSQ